LIEFLLARFSWNSTLLTFYCSLNLFSFFIRKLYYHWLSLVDSQYLNNSIFLLGQCLIVLHKKTALHCKDLDRNHDLYVSSFTSIVFYMGGFWLQDRAFLKFSWYSRENLMIILGVSELELPSLGYSTPLYLKSVFCNEISHSSEIEEVRMRGNEAFNALRFSFLLSPSSSQ